MRSLSRISGLLPAIWVVAAGCTSPERDFGGEGGSGGVTGCPSTHTCVEVPAAGWSVPVAVAEGTPPPSCPSDYPDVVLDAKNGLSFDPAICDCTCGAPSVDCGSLRFLWGGFACLNQLGQHDVIQPPDMCIMVPMQAPGVEATFIEVPPGTCPPQPAVAVDPPQFDTNLRACGGATQGDCEGVCVPKVIPPFSHACVYRQGDHPCPSGYLVKTAHYASVNDTRGCSNCTCSNPGTVTCSTTIHTFSDTLCTIPKSPTFMSDGTCAQQFSGYFTYDPPAIMGAPCFAGPVIPTGSVELTDLYTICCAA